MDNATTETIEAIAADTDDKFHTEAAIKVARLAGDADALVLLTEIKTFADLEGYTPHGSIVARITIVDRCLAQLDADVAAAVRAAL